MHRLQSPGRRALACAVLAWALATGHQACSDQFLSWPDFLALHGEHPYQSRVLIFLAARLVMQVTHGTPSQLMGVFWLFDLAAMMASISGMWRLGQACGMRQPVLLMVVWLWQMVMTYMVSQVHNWYYPYDFPAQAWMVWGCVAIVARWPFARLAVLTLVAMLNRETAIWLPIWYAVWHGREDRAALYRAAWLLAACVLVRLGLAWWLDGLSKMALPGVPRQGARVVFNLGFLRDPARMWFTLNVVLAFGGLWVMLARAPRLSAPLRRVMWTLWPNLLLLAIVANLAEVRVFAEFFPLMALAIVEKWPASRKAQFGQESSTEPTTAQ